MSGIAARITALALTLSLLGLPGLAGVFLFPLAAQTLATITYLVALRPDPLLLARSTAAEWVCTCGARSIRAVAESSPRGGSSPTIPNAIASTTSRISVFAAPSATAPPRGGVCRIPGQRRIAGRVTAFRGRAGGWCA